MKKGIALPFVIILILFSVVFILAWSPWVTKEFAMFRLNGTSCAPLMVIPIYSEPVSTEKVLFGRKLLEVSGGCGTGTFDYFVSAIGTVHQLKSVEYKTTAANITVYTEASRSVHTDEGRANWKIYTGQVIKISFQYPPDWTVTEEPGVDLGDPNGPVNKSIQLSGDKGISFSIIDNFYGGLPGGTDISSEEIYIDNIKTKKKSYRVTGDSLGAKPSDYDSIPTSATIDFQRNGKYYTILASFGWNEADLKEANKTIDQILSTFKFTQ